jgi:translocation protein SEC63
MKKAGIRLALTLGWVLFAFVAYQVTQAEYEYANFDPFEILGIAPVSW